MYRSAHVLSEPGLGGTWSATAFSGSVIVQLPLDDEEDEEEDLDVADVFGDCLLEKLLAGVKRVVSLGESLCASLGDAGESAAASDPP